MAFCTLKKNPKTPVSWFVESHLLYGPLHQVAPRWKHCVLETKRGFDLILRHLLSERIAHREVRSHHKEAATEFVRLI